MGAYTELYAGLSEEVGLQKNGTYVILWGRVYGEEVIPPKDLVSALRMEKEGGWGMGRSSGDGVKRSGGSLFRWGMLWDYHN